MALRSPHSLESLALDGEWCLALIREDEPRIGEESQRRREAGTPTHIFFLYSTHDDDCCRAQVR